MNDIYAILNKLNIIYEKIDHPAVYTVDEAEKHTGSIKGTHNKSIFLRNKKGDKYYLVITIGSKRLDLKKLQVFLNESKLSFASPERLLQHLKLTPGSVSPFGLINDVHKKVQVIVDEELLQFEKVGFHPNINTATLIITTDDLKIFLKWINNKIVYIKL